MNLPPFQQLLDDHSVDLYRFCVAQAGADHGPDCFQEAVIAALRAYPDLRDASNLRGWFFTIAHHKVLDHHRAAARRPVPVAGALDGAALGTGAPETSVPETMATDALVDRDLWSAVAALPDKQRGAIALRYLADLPYAEIAVTLACSEAAARQNVRAGLAGLRERVTR